MKKVDSAPANKASDLNTASAWLISGDLNQVPDRLKVIVSQESSIAIKENIECPAKIHFLEESPSWKAVI